MILDLFKGEIIRVVDKGVLEAEDAESNRRFYENFIKPDETTRKANRFKDYKAINKGFKRAVKGVKYVVE